jgi:hypothetical protein
MIRTRWLIVLAALSLLLAACSSAQEATTTASPETTVAPAETTTAPAETTTAPAETTTAAEEPEVRTLEAPSASITVDGDPSDWVDVPTLELTLDPIADETAEPRSATIQVAHDSELMYVLFSVEDDYNWDPADAHLSASSAVMWRIDAGAGEHMGAEEPDRETSLGMVDIWHWELECAAGEQNGGGTLAGPGDGDLGNDGACNFDDEYANIPEERFDDNDAASENTLLGVWTHTAPTADSAGFWIFEMSRPLATGDPFDGQIEVGGASAGMALAYWDPDFGPAGWEDATHVQSSNEGWIEVNFVA